MASEVDISNLALSMLGEEADVVSISPPDTVNSGHCKRFYPLARDAMLERYPWTFATTRAPLALLDLDELPPEWAYAYARPQCLKVVAVFPPSVIQTSTPSGAIFNREEWIKRARAFPFECEALDSGEEVIYTNIEDATALYVRRVTDAGKFRPLFVTALARLLAAHLAGTVIKGTVGVKVAEGHLKAFEQVDLPRAQTSDASNSHNSAYDTFTPSSIAARS